MSSEAMEAGVKNQAPNPYHMGSKPRFLHFIDVLGQVADKLNGESENTFLPGMLGE